MRPTKFAPTSRLDRLKHMHQLCVELLAEIMEILATYDSPESSPSSIGSAIDHWQHMVRSLDAATRIESAKFEQNETLDKRLQSQ